MLYAIVVFFGNFLDLKIIFGEMFLKHGICDKIFFLQKNLCKITKNSHNKIITWDPCN
jgi:hypothetical protein